MGGQRQLDLFRYLKCEKISFSKTDELKKLLDYPGNVVVLASGDPGIYGILDLVLRYKNKEEVEVIPGISSIQYIMAKLRLPMKDMAIVSLHGREEDLLTKVHNNSITVVLTDKEHNPRYIAEKLMKESISDVKIFVGENLSYAEEVITSFTVEELVKSSKEFDINVVVIKRCGNTD